MGITTLGAERAIEPVPRRAGGSPVSEKLQAPRGHLRRAARRRRAARLELLRLAAEVLGRAGYEPFETPVFEDTEVFARGVGESTDIVQKEMFTFEDKGGRSLTLRPEDTAGVCRAYVEHGMHKLAPAGEALVLGAVLSPRGAAGRPLSPVHPARRRGARLRRSLARRRADPAAGRARWSAPAPARRGCGSSSLGNAETRAAYCEELHGLPARARGRALGRGARAASTRTRCARSTPTTRAPAR